MDLHLKNIGCSLKFSQEMIEMTDVFDLVKRRVEKEAMTSEFSNEIVKQYASEDLELMEEPENVTPFEIGLPDGDVKLIPQEIFSAIQMDERENGIRLISDSSQITEVVYNSISNQIRFYETGNTEVHVFPLAEILVHTREYIKNITEEKNEESSDSV